MTTAKSITLTAAELESIVASAVTSAIAAGTPQVKVRQARNVAIRLETDAAKVAQYGSVQLGKLDEKGEFVRRMVIRKDEIKTLRTLLAAAEKEAL